MDGCDRNSYVYGDIDVKDGQKTALTSESVEVNGNPPLGPKRDYPECSTKAAIKTVATYIAFMAGVS